MVQLVKNIDRSAVLRRGRRPGLMSANALRTLVAYSLFANGEGDECWVGDRVLADAVVYSLRTIERGKAELVRLGLVQLVPAGEWPRAATTIVHHRLRVVRLDRKAIEALPSRIPSRGGGYTVRPAALSRQEGTAPPYVEVDLKKRSEGEEEEETDHLTDTDLEPAWAVADAVAADLRRPAPSRGEKSELSLRKLRADAVAVSAEHWETALRARLRLFYEQTDPWLDKNRWPLGSALQVAQPQLQAQTYGGEIVAGRRGRLRVIRVAGEIVGLSSSRTRTSGRRARSMRPRASRRSPLSWWATKSDAHVDFGVRIFLGGDSSSD